MNYYALVGRTFATDHRYLTSVSMLLASCRIEPGNANTMKLSKRQDADANTSFKVWKEFDNSPMSVLRMYNYFFAYPTSQLRIYWLFEGEAD